MGWSLISPNEIMLKCFKSNGVYLNKLNPAKAEDFLGGIPSVAGCIAKLI